MNYEFDDNKNQSNIAKHGINFEQVEGFDFETAVIENDDRVTVEDRYIATGFIGKRLHILVFTFRGNNVRVISLRKANKREVRKYG